MSSLQTSRHISSMIPSPPSHFVPVGRAPSNPAESEGFFGYAMMLWRHRGKLALLTLAGAMLGLLISMIQPRVYKSTAVLEIQRPSEDLLKVGNTSSSSSSPNTGSGDSYVQTQAEILRQEAMIEKVVAKMNLTNKAEFTPRPSLWDRLGVMVGLAPNPLPPPNRYATERVKDDLEIVPIRESQIINVVFESRDPEVAANVPNALAQTLIETSIEARLNAATEVQEWLRPQLTEFKAKLEKSQSELQQFQRLSGLQLTSGQENLAEDRLRLIQGEHSKAEADRVAKEAIYQALSAGPPDALADNSAIQEYRLRLTELRRQLADLGTLLQPESYKITRLNAQINQLETAIQQELAKSVNRLRDEYYAARNRESMLNTSYNRQWSQVSGVSEKMMHYDTLKQEVEATRQFYEAMVLKANEASVASVIRPSNIRLLTKAQPPLRPQRPNLPLNLILGTFLGLVVGIGFISMKEQSVQHLRMPGDSETYLSIPELGAIPSAGALTQRKLLGIGQNRKEQLELVSWERKLSGVSESFRNTVTSILTASDPSGNPPRVLVVTSPLPEEGKTTVTTNLAITLAQLGRRTLLIDGDLRRPRIHSLFDLANTRGLSTLLRENDHVAIDDAPLEALIHTTKIPNLSVVLSGPGTDDIAKLMYSTRLDKLMRRFRAEFDHILIDAPPSMMYADGRLLGRHSDGLILVLRADHTNYKTAMTVIQRFVMDGVPVLGTVLNAWNPKSSTSYGYQGYGYSIATGD